MDRNTLTDLVTNRHNWIQRSHGILEDHGNLIAAHLFQFLRCHFQYIFSIQFNLAVFDDPRRIRNQIQNRKCRGSLARAGLAHQTQGLALADGKAHVIHGLNVLAVLAHTAGGEILLQVLDFNQRLVFTHSAFSPFSNAAFCCSQQ